MHDSNFLDVYESYKWAIYTMDKAYVDYEALYGMHLNGTYFVTRAKATMKYDVVDINYYANDLVGIVGDKTIHLSGYVSEKKHPVDLRLIEFYDVEKDEQQDRWLIPYTSFAKKSLFYETQVQTQIDLRNLSGKRREGCG